MNYVQPPNRAFGIGEQKEQNAVIKVYSIGQLKNALTKIYQLQFGVGTIQIAGDITITEPIKLKSFDAQTIAPREIIIQAVAGARIINGTTDVDIKFNYNIAGYNYIPVFDFGYVDSSITNSCKYTFKDLTINSGNSRIPFGSLIGFGLSNSTATTSRITITNLKAYNLGMLFGAYSAAGTFTQTIYGLNYVVSDVAVDNTNVPAAITGLYTTSTNYELEGANISNYGIVEPTFLAANSNLFFDAGNNKRCILQNIRTLVLTNSSNSSAGNTCISCEISANNPTPYVTLINSFISNINGFGNKTQISTGGLFGPGSLNAFTIYYQFDSSTPASIDSTYNIFVGSSSSSNIDTILNTAGAYLIQYNITVKYANDINNYILAANVRHTGAVYVITSTSVEYAAEELVTLNSVFSVTAGGIRLNLNDFTNGPFLTTGTVKITGQGLIT